MFHFQALLKAEPKEQNIALAEPIEDKGDENIRKKLDFENPQFIE